MDKKFSQEVRAIIYHPMALRCALRLLVATTTMGCSGSVSQGTMADDTPNGSQGGAGASGPGTQFTCNEESSVGAGRWRRLTKNQYVNTVRDLLGQSADTAALVPDAYTGPFKTNSLFPIQEGDVGAYDSIAETIAAKAVVNLNGLLACDVKAVGEDKCAAQFIKTFGARAYRRPLQSEEEAALNAAYKTGKEESFTVGIRLVVESLLSSPSFLYLVENGKGSAQGLHKLNGYEVASRLSYALTASMPDAELFAAAAKGSLENSDGVRSYAKKLIESGKFIGVAQDFHTQLLGADAIVNKTEVSKGGKFPQFDEAMRAAMLEEPRKLVGYVMSKGSKSVEEILSASYVFPAGPLSKIYGENLQVDGDGRAQITDGTRRGLLSLAGVQAVHPKQFSPSAAVNRGHLVRRDFLCEEVPPPTIAVDFTPPPNAEKMTAQERLREHQTNPSCIGCHSLMDSIGFGFERYDQLGVYRSKDSGGREIDSSGEIVGLAENGKFENMGEMANILAKSSEVRTCMSKQWLRFALGRDPSQEDGCSLQAVTKSFLNGDGNIESAILSLVSSDAFRFNRGE